MRVCAHIIYIMYENTSYSIRIGGKLLDLTFPVVMGILNATPDSFYANSRNQCKEEICKRAEQILEEGGSIIDIGGYSTRPGATDVPEEEETRRLRTAIQAVREVASDAFLSIDTFRASVAERLLDEFGPFIINDVSAAQDPDMLPLVERARIPYVYTFVGVPQGVLPEAWKQLEPLVDVIVDPGFGFGKTLDQNYEVMRNLAFFHHLRRPLLVGVSRKSMITRLLECPTEEALNGTTVLHTVSLQSGANILRVHDVKAAKEAITLISKLRNY